jgi:multiple sugar transport system ATP-binding protein
MTPVPSDPRLLPGNFENLQEAETMAGVTLEEVCKYFDKVVAVQDVNLEIQDREFLILVGPSGCGKSTTLRMIAGLEEASRGKIYIGNRMVNDVEPKDRNIAMVFQNYALYPHMSVYNNMGFGLKMLKFPKDEIDKRVREASRILRIEELLDRKPRQLSGGQRQRVAVGRAIVRQPDVFLFDEPLSNLDAKLRMDMRTELVKLHDKLNATMVYVTHDQVEAMSMGDRIVVMKDGVIQQVGTPLEVYDRPHTRFVAGFIGSPTMNFFAGRLGRGESNKQLVFETAGLTIPLPQKQASRYERFAGRDVIFGIRPQDIRDELPEKNAELFEGVEATVEVVEHLGSEVILELSRGDLNFKAIIGPHTGARSHEKILLYLNMAGVHIFDADTEEVLD